MRHGREGKKLNNSPWRDGEGRKMNGGDSGKDDTHPVFFPKICHGLLETLGINLSSLGSGHVGAKLHRIKTDFHSIYCRIPGV